MMGNAEIILVRRDGALILQQRDDKPDITNPGLITTFGGGIEPSETPLQAAVREINEETNLQLHAADLEFFGHYQKTKQQHGEDREVYYFVARDIDDSDLQVYEGQGYVIVSDAAALKQLKTSVLAREVLGAYFSKISK